VKRLTLASHETYLAAEEIDQQSIFHSIFRYVIKLIHATQSQGNVIIPLDTLIKIEEDRMGY